MAFLRILTALLVTILGSMATAQTSRSLAHFAHLTCNGYFKIVDEDINEDTEIDYVGRNKELTFQKEVRDSYWIMGSEHLATLEFAVNLETNRFNQTVPVFTIYLKNIAGEVIETFTRRGSPNNSIVRISVPNYSRVENGTKFSFSANCAAHLGPVRPGR